MLTPKKALHALTLPAAQKTQKAKGLFVVVENRLHAVIFCRFRLSPRSLKSLLHLRMVASGHGARQTALRNEDASASSGCLVQHMSKLVEGSCCKVGARFENIQEHALHLYSTRKEIVKPTRGRTIDKAYITHTRGPFDKSGPHLAIDTHDVRSFLVLAQLLLLNVQVLQDSDSESQSERHCGAVVRTEAHEIEYELAGSVLCQLGLAEGAGRGGCFGTWERRRR